jgi:copper chaperone
MKTHFEVNNLKCSGCVDSVKKALDSFPEIENASVDLVTKSVEFEHPETFPVSSLKEKLKSLGYPEKPLAMN